MYQRTFSNILCRVYQGSYTSVSLLSLRFKWELASDDVGSISVQVGEIIDVTSDSGDDAAEDLVSEEA